MNLAHCVQPMVPVDLPFQFFGAILGALKLMVKVKATALTKAKDIQEADISNI